PSMKEIRAEIEIAAPAERVWRVLTEFGSFPDWNSFLAVPAGAATPGARLTVRITPVGRRPMTFRPIVEVATPSRELRWLGRLGIPGLFDGRHRFEIIPLADGRVRFVQSEEFRGILVGLVLGKGLTDATRAGFEHMNLALRERAEAGTIPAPPVA
ncbi:MAG TPA: SRPBCC domain-containing protein, partial [Thermoplasmata archaeon]